MKRFEPFGGSSMQECTNGDYVRADDVLAIIKGCWDYSGGYRGNVEHLEIYRHGMQTILSSMNAALKSNPSDTQSNATLIMGREANQTGVLPNDQPNMRIEDCQALLDRALAIINEAVLHGILPHGEV